MQDSQAEINYFIHKLACVDTDRIGANTHISAFVVIEADVQIGNNVIIHPHVTIS
jgi:UDP-3-O-[3-hydroxymyristoyl] glucosamine N-acyltransferase